MTLFTQSTFKTLSRVQSLSWRGDELVDWVGGGNAFTLDGTEHLAVTRYAYRFDAAVASPNGDLAVIYEKFGTKGLIVREGEIVREIDRSYYLAGSYEYPVALFNAPDGRLVLAHCPEEYCQIEFEDAETGISLAKSIERRPADFFHSRLAANRSGTRLLSAGWLWHPFHRVVHFDVRAALTNSQLLDNGEIIGRRGEYNINCEESTACWLGENCIAIAASSNAEDPAEGDEVPEEPRLLPRGLAIYDLPNSEYLGSFKYDEPLGTIVAVGTQHILSLYQHPKLIEVATGKILYLWSKLQSGLQQSSIVGGLVNSQMPPPYAFDPEKMRFAIANGKSITVLQFHL